MNSNIGRRSFLKALFCQKVKVRKAEEKIIEWIIWIMEWVMKLIKKRKERKKGGRGALDI